MRIANQSVKPVRVSSTRFDRVLIFLATFLFAMLWVLAIVFYVNAPNKVPTGFDVAGNPCAWGSPMFYFMMPAIGMFYGVAMFVSTYFPQLINLPITLKQQTVVTQSALMIRCCHWLNIIGQLMFLFIQLQMAGYQCESLRIDSSIFMGGLYSLIFLMIGVIIYYCVCISKVK